MQITLHIEGDENDTVLKAVLAACAGQPVLVDESAATAPAKPVAEKAAPAKPAKAEPAPKAEKVEAAPAEEPADDEAKMEVAVTRATGLINGGKADDLRAVLGKIGVKRVSELAGADLDQFLADTA